MASSSIIILLGQEGRQGKDMKEATVINLVWPGYDVAPLTGSFPALDDSDL
jgi:hypothetical protein